MTDHADLMTANPPGHSLPFWRQIITLLLQQLLGGPRLLWSCRGQERNTLECTRTDEGSGKQAHVRLTEEGAPTHLWLVTARNVSWSDGAISSEVSREATCSWAIS